MATDCGGGAEDLSEEEADGDGRFARAEEADGDGGLEREEEADGGGGLEREEEADRLGRTDEFDGTGWLCGKFPVPEESSPVGRWDSERAEEAACPMDIGARAADGT